MIKQKFALDFQWPTQEPFLFCVHHHDLYPKGMDDFGPAKTYLAGREMGQDFQGKDGFRMYHGQTVPGFPVHPHRGFETITIVRKGYVDHADSLGAAGRYGQGDVQWMTAGRGVQHSEMFPLLRRDDSNTLELFQIWLNLPRKSKMAAPHFKMLWSEQIPTLELENKTVRLTLIAGQYGDVKPPEPPPDSWAGDPTGDVQVWLLRLEPDAKFKIPASLASSTRTLYFFEGSSLTVAGDVVSGKRGLVLDASREVLLEAGSDVVELLMLQAKPIGEPVVQHGPFVMTSQSEILQTIRDYQATEFGGWSWPRNDMIHGPKIRRFAKYPDGKIEEKS